MDGIAVSRREDAGEARTADSRSRAPVRTRRSPSRLRKPWAIDSPTGREAVATCSRVRRAIPETVSAGSPRLNASRMRAARDKTDSR
ncbi:hypothetical protein SUDANB6_00506 [Streptomyces sp. enrichment culture]